MSGVEREKPEAGGQPAATSVAEAGSAPGAEAARLVRLEAAALETMAQRLESSGAAAFAHALDLLADTVRRDRRVVLCGVGKSGFIARKTAATLISLSIPAVFLHPAEAVHGDLGMVRAGDTVLALSYSGETEEVVRLLPLLRALGVHLVSLCGCPASSLALASAAVLDVSVDREACVHQLAPTASTTAMLAAGDALAVELSRRLGFAPQDFAALHPGGHLGRRLTPVRELMHTGTAVPAVGPGARLPEIMHEMSAKRLGMTTVQAGGRLLGVLSDGDLRRLMERDGAEAFNRTAAEVMHRQPRRVAAGMFAADALALMETHKITALIVGESSGELSLGGASEGTVEGVVHMHDLLESMGAGPAPGPVGRASRSENKLS